MATTTLPRSPNDAPVRGGLGVSRYDQVAGLLLATLLFFGCITLVMFLIWLSNRTFRVAVAVPVTVLEDIGGGGSGTGPLSGGIGELQQPDVSEVAVTSSEPAVEESLLAAASVVAERASELTVLDGDMT